jgi:hypothetical protein
VKSEIDDLQKNALFKSPLSGSTLANDLNNNIISNVQTLGFRSSTYNLGSNLSGTVTVDLTYGDVQYGEITPTIPASISLEFTKWPPTDTYSSVQVILKVMAGQTINLPVTATTGVLYGTTTLEGFDPATNNITVPTGVDRLHFQFNSRDCGETIEIVPLDRPRITAQIQNITPTTSSSVGTKGQISYDSNYIYVCVDTNTWARVALNSTIW